MVHETPKKLGYNNIVKLFDANVETAAENAISCAENKNLVIKTTQKTSEIFKVFLVVLLFM